MVASVSARVLVLGMAITACSPASYGVSAELLDEENSWQAYRHRESNGGDVCYAGARPKSSIGAGQTRGQAYLTVSFWPVEQRLHEVSLVAGTEIGEPTVEVSVFMGETVPSQYFTLYSEGDRAWTPGEEDDRRLFDAMKRGGQMTVSIPTGDGREINDEYSLWGFTAMSTRAMQACGVDPAGIGIVY